MLYIQNRNVIDSEGRLLKKLSLSIALVDFVFRISIHTIRGLL
jgi:hypothetical protein